MNRLITILAVVLSIQVLISIVALFDNDDMDAYEPDKPLLTFNSADVNRVLIEAADNESLEMVKQDGVWVLPTLHNYPVNPERMNELFAKLASFRKGWPVATTASASERFQVGENNFERKIVLYRNDKPLAELLLGSSPGLRKIHARTAGESEIYAIEYNAYEVAAYAENWLDEFLPLHVLKDAVQINIAGMTFVKQEGGWAINGLAANESPDKEQVDLLLPRLSSILVNTVLGIEADPAYGLAAPVLEYSFTMSNGERISFAYAKTEGTDYHVLKASHLPYYFTVPDVLLAPYKELTRASFIKSARQGSAQLQQSVIPGTN